jgi:hypothetical protein
MWRMERPDGRSAHLVVGQTGTDIWVAWFLGNRAIGMRDFGDLGSAIRFSDSMQAQNWAVGWRLVEDVGDRPPAE